MSNSISAAPEVEQHAEQRGLLLVEHLRPVKAGMVGGSYSPLSPEGEKNT